MKKFIKVSKNQSGTTLIWTLIALAIGSMLIMPLLSLMDTSLKTSYLREEKMREFYALDAGIEDATSRIRGDYSDAGFELPVNPGDQVSYILEDDVNRRQVDVTIESIWLLEGLETDKYGTMPHAGLIVVGSASNLEGERGTYKIQLSYDGSVGNLKLERIAAWLPSGFSYVPGSTSGLLSVDPTPVPHRGGTALMWDFSPSVDFDTLPVPDVEPSEGFQPAVEYPLKRELTFEFTPGSYPTGAFCWIRTIRNDIYLGWDTSSATYRVTSTATDPATGETTTAEAYVARSKVGDGLNVRYGDYRAMGNSLMVDTDHDSDGIRDKLLSQSSATIEKHTDYSDGDLPADARVESAYLYWSAWWNKNDADRAVTFQVNAGVVNSVTASRWSILPNGSGTYAYSCFADVTPLLTGVSAGGDGTAYTITVGDVSAEVGDEWSYAGWSLIIVYSSTSEAAHRLYLYDDFLYAAPQTTHTLDIEAFLAPADNSTGRLTCFAGEGDEVWGGQNQGPSDIDYVKVNGQYLSDAVSPWDNVWNGASSGLRGEFIDGVDMETFDISSYVSPGDTSATVELGTGADIWNLVYVMLSFRSDISEGWQLYVVRIITCDYNV